MSRLRPRKEPRQARSRATVEAILEAAAQIVEVDGVNGTTTQRIADRAGVSIGTLYQYFPTMEAVLAALLGARVEGAFARLARLALEADSRPLGELVATVVEQLFATFLQRPRLTFELLEHRSRVLDPAARTRRHALAAEFIEEGLRRRSERLAPGDLGRAAWVLVKTAEALVVEAYREDPSRLTDPGFQRELVELACRYLGVEPPSESPPSARAPER